VERLWLLAIFGSVAALVHFISGPSPQERIILRRTIAVRPSKTDPLALEDEELAVPFSQRVLGPAVNSFRSRILRYTPVGARKRAEEKILRAGRPVEVGTLFTIRFLLVGGLLVVAILLGVFLPGASAARRGLAVVCLPAGGFLLPDIWLNGLVGRRRRAIETALPDVLDLLTISVEAGLGFDAAIQRVAEKFHGPMGEELQGYIKEVKLGRPRVEALRGLSRRTDLADVRTFVAALIQAEQLGVSLANVLRVQADQMRYRRKQRAQERAMKMPVKILFPLVIFILPTVFIVLFAPLAVHMMEVLKGT
jgi:tight adherence protein C